MDRAPLGATDNILTMARKLGLAVFRVGWASKKSIESAPRKLRESVEEFIALDKYVDVYIVAPVDHYSVSRHVESDIDGSVIAPRGWEQAFAAVDMMIPHLRMISAQAAEFRKAAADLENRIDGLARKIRDEVRARAQVARGRELSIEDPLLFAVLTGSDITQDTAARIGPCWGPDIDEDLVRQLITG